LNRQAAWSGRLNSRVGVGDVQGEWRPPPVAAREADAPSVSVWKGCRR